jgi:non-ribosomal peptide synthetase component F
LVVVAGDPALRARWAGRDDLLGGSRGANRVGVETVELLVFYVTRVVLGGRRDGGPCARDAVARARATALAAFEHSALPFERLVEAVEAERDTSRSPLVQVVFVLQNAYMGTFGESLVEAGVDGEGADGLALEPLPLEIGTAKLDLILSLVDLEEQGGATGWGGLGGFLELATDLFDGTTGLRLLGHYRALLEGMALDPDRPLGDVPLLVPTKGSLS